MPKLLISKTSKMLTFGVLKFFLLIFETKFHQNQWGLVDSFESND